MFVKKIKTVVNIEGMSCEHCANKVFTALSNLENVNKVKVSVAKKEAIIFSTEKLNVDEIKKVIEEFNYKVTNIVEK